MPASVPRWLREPLIHFVLLGVAVFAIDRLVIEDDQPAPGVISVDSDRRAELAARFEQRRGRPPTPDELQQAVGEWVEAEILYREGLRLGLHHTDGAVRDRVVERMRLLLAHAQPIDQVPEQDLRAWFDRHRKLYQRPARFHFAQVLIEGSQPAQRRDAEELLRRLRGGLAPETLGERYREFHDRTGANVAAMYGPEFASALQAQPPGQWQLRQSPRGLHLVRLDQLRDAGGPSFEAARAQVEEDWRAHRRRELAGQGLSQLRKNYEIQGGGT